MTIVLAALPSTGLMALGREQAIVAAFWTLVGAAAFVSLGAWILLRREVRRQRTLHEPVTKGGSGGGEAAAEAAAEGEADLTGEAGPLEDSGSS